MLLNVGRNGEENRKTSHPKLIPNLAVRTLRGYILLSPKERGAPTPAQGIF